MNIDKQIISDLYEVICSQHSVIYSLVANDHALVETLANDPSLSDFVDAFQKKQAHALKNPSGSLAQALVSLQHMLDVVGEKLKRDIGGWEN
jgi:hypothetical protein